MQIDIKNRHNHAVIFSNEQKNNSVKLTLETAITLKTNLSGADLSGANLSGANLSGANLIGSFYGIASISYCPLQILGLTWNVLIFDYHIKIGCKLFLTVEWDGFSDEQITRFDENALTFWREYKPMIMAAAKAHQKYNEDI